MIVLAVFTVAFLIGLFAVGPIFGIVAGLAAVIHLAALVVAAGGEPHKASRRDR